MDTAAIVERETAPARPPSRPGAGADRAAGEGVPQSPRSRLRRVLSRTGAAGRVRAAITAARAEPDRGSAIVEAIAAMVVLLIPLVYLVLTLARLQAAAFAVEGAARDAAHMYATADDAATGAERAGFVADYTLTSRGFGDDLEHKLEATCLYSPCHQRGGEIAATVTVDVPLPFIPASITDRVPLVVTIEATRDMPIDRFREEL